MFPPSSSLSLSIDAISGITGSVSIACWVVVFSPQIIENFRRGSAEGLSLTFLILWLAGDVFNVLGAWLQGVLPTMIILAVYYTLADIVLVIQCLYYYRTNSPKEAPLLTETSETHSLAASEDSPLLSRQESNRRVSIRTLGDNAHHLSPATPFIEPEYLPRNRKRSDVDVENIDAVAALQSQQRPGGQAKRQWLSILWSISFNTVVVALVVGSGVFGWFISQHQPSDADKKHPIERPHSPLEYNIVGQVFGYLCAVLYLGSRIPQIILNFKRKSCEGVSLLFFLFACLGNTTYVISILAYEPSDELGQGYWDYIGVNASWLLGSLGTLGLDFIIFVQFFKYHEADNDWESDEGYSTEEDNEQHIHQQNHENHEHVEHQGNGRLEYNTNVQSTNSVRQ